MTPPDWAVRPPRRYVDFSGGRNELEEVFA